MGGSVNSRILNKAALNTAGHSIVAIHAVLQMNLQIYTSSGTRRPVVSDLDVGFNIDGASGRHAALAYLDFDFEGGFAASRLKVAEPEIFSMSLDMAGEAHQRGVIQADMAIDLELADKMQFAHITKAPPARVMIVEAEVRSSTLDRERK